MISYDPTFTYGTRLVLYDNGRRELEVVRPDETQVMELKDGND